MPDNLKHPDLVAKIALNSKLTAHEVEEALEVLSAAMQETLQNGGTVDLLGIGIFSVENKQVVFTPGQSLREIVSDPSISVKIERGLPGTDKIFDPKDKPYGYRVNVC